MPGIKGPRALATKAFGTVDDFMMQTGGIPAIRTPDSKWLKGPFFMNVALPTVAGSAGETDLVASPGTILTSDPRVLSSYTSSDVPKAIGRMVGVQLVVIDPVFRNAAISEKVTLFRELRMRTKIGNAEDFWALGSTANEPLNELGQLAAADASLLVGKPYRMSRVTEIDWERDEWAIRLQAGALAAAYTCVLMWWGHVFPNDAQRDPRINVASGKCPHGGGMTPGQANLITAEQRAFGIQPDAPPAVFTGTSKG